ncbi:hypothetical protein ACVGVM_01420 [Pseudonocardia bannensis]|uniref:hypothetical protein n=1 Tax=Pseudonocardia bannensis TaxID=630973 RepID=UPI002484628E|nr:hypothetical protein [Pseudonocardia bannensis]
MTGQARPDLTVDGQLCFALYAASRAMTGRYRPLLDELTGLRDTLHGLADRRRSADVVEPGRGVVEPGGRGHS